MPRLQGAAARMLADLMRSLTNRLPAMAAAEASSVAQGTMHMVAASLAPTPHTVERARPAMESSLRRQACRFIEMHLDEPDLDSEDVCHAIKLSRASLYRLFEPYGGVAAHIRERRLVRIHAAICSSAQGPAAQRRPLARLAEEHGFKSAAQFSRAFREHFGCSPSEVGSSTCAPVPKAAELPYDESLAAWLQPLRG